MWHNPKYGIRYKLIFGIAIRAFYSFPHKWFFIFFAKLLPT